MTTHQQIPKRLPSIDVQKAGRHYCRPVHPECSALSNRFSACNCFMLWGGEATPSPLHKAYVRLDKRTKWGRLLGRGMGHAPDADEMVSYGLTRSSTVGGDDAYEPLDYERSMTSEVEATGFWKESSFLLQFVDSASDYPTTNDSA